MDVQKFKEVIQKLSEAHYEDDGTIEWCWKEEVHLLSEDIPSTIDYLKNECTSDEFVWISEIIDDLAEVTQSRELVECYKSLMTKFSEETAKYNIAFCVECAEGALEDSDA